MPYTVFLLEALKEDTGCTNCPQIRLFTAIILHSINKIISAYHQRGFAVTNMQMDNAFEMLRDDLNMQKVTLNTVAANEHEPTIERCIRNVKERCRCAYAGLPLKHLPKKLGVELVNAMVYCINSVPRQDGIHPVLSPRTIMTGQQLTAKHVEFQLEISWKLLNLSFGTLAVE